MSNTITSAERQRLYAEAERLWQMGYTQAQIAAELESQVGLERARHAAAKVILRSRNPNLR